MNRITTLGFALLATAIATNVLAQALPSTDIWLATIENGVPGDPVKISEGTGYNNQPHFSTNGSVIYYTREMPDDTATQTDIAAFNIETSVTAMVTHSAESEYSPTPIPGKHALSVIQVEPDQRQRLWSIDLQNGKMDVLFPNIEPVGYHTWFSDSDVAMFILGDSFTLQTSSLHRNGARLVADNIGRSLHTHPQTGEVLFVDKNSDPLEVAAFSPKSRTITSVMPLFPGNEDFTIDNEGNYWTGNGSKLYKRAPGDGRWELMADFKMFGINQISRLAIHLESGRIAVTAIAEPPLL